MNNKGEATRIRAVVRSVMGGVCMAGLLGITTGCGDPVVVPPPAAVPVEKAPLYANNFEQVEAGKTPEELLIIDGDFQVAQEEGNRVLRLPVQALNEHGFLCGPAGAAGMEVVARIRAEKLKRQYPQLAVGLYGLEGVRLKLTAASGELELFTPNGSLGKSSVAWTSGQWTWFRLRAEKKADGSRRILGRVWAEGQAEPAAWTVQAETREELEAGKASVWCAPFSDTSGAVDDVTVRAVE